MLVFIFISPHFFILLYQCAFPCLLVSKFLAGPWHTLSRFLSHMYTRFTHRTRAWQLSWSHPLMWFDGMDMTTSNVLCLAWTLCLWRKESSRLLALAWTLLVCMMGIRQIKQLFCSVHQHSLAVCVSERSDRECGRFKGWHDRNRRQVEVERQEIRGQTD